MDVSDHGVGWTGQFEVNIHVMGEGAPPTAGLGAVATAHGGRE